jgi:hypothetical protein
VLEYRADRVGDVGCALDAVTSRQRRRHKPLAFFCGGVPKAHLSSTEDPFQFAGFPACEPRKPRGRRWGALAASSGGMKLCGCARRARSGARSAPRLTYRFPRCAGCYLAFLFLGLLGSAGRFLGTTPAQRRTEKFREGVEDFCPPREVTSAGRALSDQLTPSITAPTCGPSDSLYELFRQPPVPRRGLLHRWLRPGTRPAAGEGR